MRWAKKKHGTHISQYIPAVGPFLSAEKLPRMSPGLAYQTYFNGRTEDTIAELDTDIRRSLRSTIGAKGRRLPEGFLRQNDTYLGPWGDEEVIFGLRNTP